MKLFSSLLVLLAPLLTSAQDLTQSAVTAPVTAATEPEPDTAAPAKPPGPAASAFTLTIIAPDDIRQLLERHLELQRYRALTDLTDGELDRLLDTARSDVHQLVATLGYFSPEINITRPGADGKAGDRAVQIGVSPGEAAHIAQVSLRFTGAIANDPDAATQRQLIEHSWLLPAGKRFTQTDWSAAKQQALSQLTSQRYPTGNIKASLADVDPLSHRVQLEVTLDSGPLYQFGALNISGLKRFDTDLVRRLARLPSGADYDLKELVSAQQRLVDSGYFDSAFVQLDTTSSLPAAPVLVTVREAPRQKITLGVGASTDSGARLSAEHLHQQVPGLGWRALSKLSVDRETRSIGTELLAPPSESGWRWNTSIQLQNQPSGSFDVGSQRWRAGSSQNSQRIDRSVYLQYDRADTATSATTAAVVAESISANYAFTLRNFDAMPFPSDGWALGVELGGGSTLGSSQVPYGRVLARWQSFWPLGLGLDPRVADLRAGRLALRAQAGAVLAKDAVSLPTTQLFLAGGDNNVRGYGLHDIGIELPNGQVSAGRYLALGSVEWQRPIAVNGLLSDWEGDLFVDAGAVADTPGQLQAKVGVGAGVRWKSPVGPLQMDLAYGVAVQKFRLHLSVGFAF